MLSFISSLIVFFCTFEGDTAFRASERNLLVISEWVYNETGVDINLKGGWEKQRGEEREGEKRIEEEERKANSRFCSRDVTLGRAPLRAEASLEGELEGLLRLELVREGGDGVGGEELLVCLLTQDDAGEACVEAGWGGGGGGRGGECANGAGWESLGGDAAFADPEILRGRREGREVREGREGREEGEEKRRRRIKAEGE